MSRAASKTSTAKRSTAKRAPAKKSRTAAMLEGDVTARRFPEDLTRSEKMLAKGLIARNQILMQRDAALKDELEEVNAEWADFTERIEERLDLEKGALTGNKGYALNFEKLRIEEIPELPPAETGEDKTTPEPPALPEAKQASDPMTRSAAKRGSSKRKAAANGSGPKAAGRKAAATARRET